MVSNLAACWSNGCRALQEKKAMRGWSLAGSKGKGMARAFFLRQTWAGCNISVGHICQIFLGRAGPFDCILGRQDEDGHLVAFHKEQQVSNEEMGIFTYEYKLGREGSRNGQWQSLERVWLNQGAIKNMLYLNLGRPAGSIRESHTADHNEEGWQGVYIRLERCERKYMLMTIARSL